ncbi:hypothetical protein FDENT_12466 [Fusarium denticulatum]|uniref:Uncharacterized protein n=1 Tax=Fusarium denticulatum TaxID=48507 RepID=A0A8H5TB08_9HYPO|nr:hypothetical protein FDENT_12466 [Fusarium denticulatum]
MGRMKAARTTRRHTPLSNTGTRSSNRIAAKKETKGTKQAGSSQKRTLSAPRDRSASQETLKNSSDSSQEPPFSSFSSYNTNDHPAEQVEGNLTLAHRNPQVHGPAATSSGPPHNAAGTLTAGDVALEIYGNRIVIDSTLGKKLAGEASLRPIRQRRSDMVLNMERRSNVEAFLAHLTGVQVSRSCKNCSKGHGPWSECIIYDGQMCGSCTNCWFNASGSRCTFHENNQNSIYAPAPLYHPQSAGMPTQPFQFAQLNPLALPQGILPINPGAAASVYVDPQMRNQFAMNMIQALGLVGNVVSNVAAMSQGERKFAQVERAAEELGIRLAELHDFLATSDGNAFMTQLSGMAPQQISSGDDQTQEPLSQEPSSQENAHQEHASENSSSYEPSSQEQSAQQASSQEGFSQENIEASPMTLTLLNTPPYEN